MAVIVANFLGNWKRLLWHWNFVTWEKGRCIFQVAVQTNCCHGLDISSPGCNSDDCLSREGWRLQPKRGVIPSHNRGDKCLHAIRCYNEETNFSGIHCTSYVASVENSLSVTENRDRSLPPKQIRILQQTLNLVFVLNPVIARRLQVFDGLFQVLPVVENRWQQFSSMGGWFLA